MKITSRFRTGVLVQNAIFLALLLAVSVLVVFLAQQSNIKLDLTYSQRNTLTDETLALLQDIDAPIEITAFAFPDADGDMQSVVSKFLTPYQAAKSDIRVNFVDPREEPNIARQAGVTKNGELRIKINERSENLKSHSEQDLVNLIIRLMRFNKRVVVGLIGHGEGDLRGQGSRDLGDLAGQLTARGFKLDTLNFASGGMPNPGDNVLLIASPTSDLLPGETNRIKRFVDNGGDLLWFVEPNKTGKLDELADLIGIELPLGIVLDPGAKLRGLPSATFALAAHYGKHPITEKMESNTLFPHSRMIVPADDGEFRFAPLVEVAEQGWFESGDIKNATFDPKSDIKGPIVVAAALERNTKERTQRIVVVGSAFAFSNEYLSSLGNSDLALGMLNWLSGDEKLISIAPKSRVDLNLDLSPLAVSLIVNGFLVVLPLGFICAGGLIWWRRRRA